jgi:hypothetical protein
MTPEEKKERKRLYDIEYRKQNAEKLKQKEKLWREQNADKKKERDRKYHEENKEQKRLYDIEYRIKNADKKKEINKQYYQKNKDNIKDKGKEYRRNNRATINQYLNNRKQTDPLFRTITAIRSLINQSFKRKGVDKPTKTEIILGCSFDEFKKHIESLWQPWMNWGNYGNPKDGIFEPNKTWDIDHIVKLSSVNTIEEIIKLNHYSNLQPLCSYHNRWVKA